MSDPVTESSLQRCGVPGCTNTVPPAVADQGTCNQHADRIVHESPLDTCARCMEPTDYGGCCNGCGGTLCEDCESMYVDDADMPVCETCWEAENAE